MSERRSSPLYVGVSTKMYLGYRQSIEWMERVRRLADERPELGSGQTVQAFVAPSLPLLESAMRIFDGSGVWVGAQNGGWSGGALTGEVSPELLAELGVRIVETGHAERRLLFHEDDEVVRRKTAATLAAGLTPLLCVGESARETATAAARFCCAQVTSALGESGALSSLVVAYEPVWAIGANEPAPPAYVNGVIAELRELLAERYQGTLARIIYGGSAGPGLLHQLGEADGLFLGRFAHDPDSLALVLDEALRLASR